MALVKTERDLFPWQVRSSFSSLIDDLFNPEISDWRRSNFSPTNTTLPKVNIRENDNEYVLEMAAPGMKKEDFKIDVDQDILSISSERQEEANKDGERYSKREFSYQAFTRTFSLPDTANSDKISARYENGILVLSIPKKEEAKPKPPKSIKIS